MADRRDCVIYSPRGEFRDANGRRDRCHANHADRDSVQSTHGSADTHDGYSSDAGRRGLCGVAQLQQLKSDGHVHAGPTLQFRIENRPVCAGDGGQSKRRNHQPKIRFVLHGRQCACKHLRNAGELREDGSCRRAVRIGIRSCARSRECERLERVAESGTPACSGQRGTSRRPDHICSRLHPS